MDKVLKQKLLDAIKTVGYDDPLNYIEESLTPDTYMEVEAFLKETGKRNQGISEANIDTLWQEIIGGHDEDRYEMERMKVTGKVVAIVFWDKEKKMFTAKGFHLDDVDFLGESIYAETCLKNTIREITR